MRGGPAARLIFDLDGTLIDSAPTICAAGNALLAELGRPPLEAGTIMSLVGMGVRNLVAGMLREGGGVPGGELAPHLARYRAIYEADPCAGTEPYPGVRETLAALAEDGHGLGVCTQKPDPSALRILRGLGLMPPITGFTGGETLDVLKPDARMFWHCAGQLGEGPPIMIGDSEIDAATARAAEVPFVLHVPGYRKASVAEIAPDACLEDYGALPAIVARLVNGRSPR